MADTVERDDSRKTVVAFITGLLIGGLLVWVFSSTPANENKTVPTAPEAPSAPSTTGSKDTSSNGNGSSTDTTSNGSASGDVVSDQGAGNSVELGSIDFPTDKGWVVVRDYANDTAGRILGAARYDVKAGLVPTMVELVRPTIAGNTYQVSFYTDEGATTFKSGEDKPIEGGEATFTAK